SEISSLRFVFYYPSTPANMKLVTIVSIAVMVMFIVLFMCVSVAVTNVLYRPVSETVGKLDSAPDDEGRIDEFALFDSTLDTLENLKDRYDQLIKENNRLSSSRYFYELLYDPDPMMDSPLNEEETDALYSVALFEYSISDDVSDEYFIQLEKTNVMVHVRSMRARYRIHYLNLSSTRFVIIFENVPHNIIRSEAASFFNVLDEGVTLSVALSDERRGIREIHNSYRQAKRIIEYRNLVNVHAIMTQSDIPDDTSDYFYYPIHTENRIVSLVVSGDRDKALSLFDSIIDENFTRAVLTNDARMNLMYSLVGTLIRIMQELKTSPVELIGRPFDFTWLYSNWANESIIERLRQNISDIAEAVAEKRNSSVGDEIVLDKMRAFIYENYSDNIMLIDIAEHLGITPKYCSALFKKLSNENFKTFLNQYRIDRACEFIRDNPDIKVADLAQQVGFNSANTFIRVFKTYKGITPGAFAENVIRERHAQE
ncbi:MAG: helix-turn-helix transcriptional regulator, partial [Bullifex sp.]